MERLLPRHHISEATVFSQSFPSTIVANKIYIVLSSLFVNTIKR